MVEYETKTELLRTSIKDLKQIAKKYGITGYTRYTSASKEDLVKEIMKVINKRKREGTAPPRATKSTETKPAPKKQHPHRSKAVEKERRAEAEAKLPLGLSCDMDHNRCKFSNKYKLEDIRRLAHFCGISTEGKTRGQLCKEIEASVSETQEEEPVYDSDDEPLATVLEREKQKKAEPKYWPGWGVEGVDWVYEEEEQEPQSDAEEPQSDAEEEVYEYYDEDGNPVDPSLVDEFGYIIEPKEEEEVVYESEPEEEEEVVYESEPEEEEEVVYESEPEEEEEIELDEEDLENNTLPGLLKLCEKAKIPCRQNQSVKSIIKALQEAKEKATIPEDKDETEGECYGGVSREYLMSLSKEELKQMLMDAGVQSAYIPITKEIMVDYLCALGMNGPCDPPDEMCEKGYVCDAGAKICLDSDLANKRVVSARGAIKKKNWDGNDFIGSKKTLDALESLLKPKVPEPAVEESVPEPVVEESGDEDDFFEIDTTSPRSFYLPDDEDDEEEVPPVKYNLSKVDKDDQCYSGRSFNDLIKLSNEELTRLLNISGVKKGIPPSVEEKAMYLCQIHKNGVCDKDNACLYPDTTCDLGSGVCIANDLAEQRAKQAGLYTLESANDEGIDIKFIGSKDAIEELGKVFKNKTEQEFSDQTQKEIEREVGALKTESEENLDKILAEKAETRKREQEEISEPSEKIASDVQRAEETSKLAEKTKASAEKLERLATQQKESAEQMEEPKTVDPEAEERRRKAKEQLAEKRARLKEEQERRKQLRLQELEKKAQESVKPTEMSEGTEIKEPKTPEKPSKLEEETEVVDIDAVLRKLQQSKGKEIGELAKAQSAVLKCLGLLG